MAEHNLLKPMLKNLMKRIMNAEITCAKLGICKYPIIVKDDERGYMNRVLKDKPPTKHPQVEQNPSVIRFIVIADVHVDYLYKEGADADCGYPICCRENNKLGFSESDRQRIVGEKMKAGKWGSLAKCDLPPVPF